VHFLNYYLTKARITAIIPRPSARTIGRRIPPVMSFAALGFRPIAEAAEKPMRPIAIAEAKTAKPKPRGPNAETAAVAVVEASSAKTASGAMAEIRANFFINRILGNKKG
jgi:hypothetical protein